MIVIPNLGIKNKTNTTIVMPISRIGKSFGELDFASLLIISPSITPSSFFLEKSFEINNPMAIAKIKAIINLRMIYSIKLNK